MPYNLNLSAIVREFASMVSVGLFVASVVAWANILSA